jgi:hypothetical protein
MRLAMNEALTDALKKVVVRFDAMMTAPGDFILAPCSNTMARNLSKLKMVDVRETKVRTMGGTPMIVFRVRPTPLGRQTLGPVR